MNLEEIEFMEKVNYTYGNEVFTNPKYHISLEKDYVAPWKTENYTKEQLNQVLDTLIF